MGDRGIVCVIFGEWPGAGEPDDRLVVYLYTHWGGEELPETVQQALEYCGVRNAQNTAAQRQQLPMADRYGPDAPPYIQAAWDDAGWLARVVFQHMLGDLDDPDLATTTLAILPYIRDPDHPVIYLDVSRQQVRIKGEAWPFAEYVDGPLEGPHAAYGGG